MEIKALLGAEDPGELAEAAMDLADALAALADAKGRPGLAPPVDVAYRVVLADGAMNNDGARALIDSGIPAEELLSALREIGAPKMAEILAGALAEPDDAAALDRWSAYPDYLEGLLVDWVTRHRAAFESA